MDAIIGKLWKLLIESAWFQVHLSGALAKTASTDLEKKQKMPKLKLPSWA